MYYSYLNDFINLVKPAWRNGLARWTSNPKVVGSSPTVGNSFVTTTHTPPPARKKKAAVVVPTAYRADEAHLA